MNKCVELYENVGNVETKEERDLKDYLAATLDYTIQTYIKANGPMSQDDFAARTAEHGEKPILWRTIDNIIKGVHSPGVDTLNQIVLAADSNLAEFFSRMVTRMELVAIERNSEDERQIVVAYVRGLSDPRTEDVVRSVARHVTGLLDRTGPR